MLFVRACKDCLQVHSVNGDKHACVQIMVVFYSIWGINYLPIRLLFTAHVKTRHAFTFLFVCFFYVVLKPTVHHLLYTLLVVQYFYFSTTYNIWTPIFSKQLLYSLVKTQSCSTFYFRFIKFLNDHWFPKWITTPQNIYY